MEVVEFSVFSVNWTDTTDADGDGFSESRRLEIDVDVDDGATYDVYAVLYYARSTDDTYTYYYTTDYYTITGREVDKFWIAVGNPNQELPSGSYDFLLEVYERTSDELVASAGPTDEAELNDERFEDSSVPVTYTLVNGTWSDVQVTFNGRVEDTIDYKDSIIYQDYSSSTGMYDVYLETLVETDNALVWRDTIYRGSNFRQRYHASDDYFLLNIQNSTNKDMNYVVVASPNESDSSYAPLSVGSQADIGYYYAHSHTDIRLWFHASNDYVYWDDYNTVSADSEAKLVMLEPDDTLGKQNAGVILHAKPIGQRPLRVYDFGDYLRTRGLEVPEEPREGR